MTKQANPWTGVGWIIFILLILLILGGVFAARHPQAASCPTGSVWSTSYQECVYP
jgi:hypothetical protein